MTKQRFIRLYPFRGTGCVRAESAYDSDYREWLTQFVEDCPAGCECWFCTNLFEEADVDH